MATQPTESVLKQGETTSLEIITNRDNIFTCNLLNPDQSTPIDLTGFSFGGGIYTDAKSSQNIASFSFVIDPDPTTGIVVASLSESDSNLLMSTCEYSYEMFYFDTLGNKEDLMYGKIILSERSL